MKKYTHKILVFIAIIGSLLSAKMVHAQGNNCAAATPLVVNAAPVSGTTAGSNTEPGEQVGCNGLGGGTPTFDQSVWYSFVATSPSHSVTINQINTACYNMYTAVYSGTCAARTRISCYEQNLATQQHNLNGLTVGATYLVQVTYGSGGPCGAAKTFDIQVLNTAASGTDDCTCAENTVIANPGSCFISDLTGTIPCLGPAGCQGANTNTTAYTIIPTGTSITISIQNVQAGFTGNVQTRLYSGGCTLTLVGSNCAALPYTHTYTGLTAGTKYYIFISTAGNSGGCNTSFGICVANGGTACSVAGCVPGVNAPGGSAYGVYAADGSATVNSAEIITVAGVSACGGAGTACLVCTPTNDAYTSVAISGYPLISAENINCLNSKMDFTSSDPSPTWRAGGLGANATATTPVSTTTIIDNSYTATTGRRTILLNGDIVARSSSTFSNTTAGAFANNSCVGVIRDIIVAGASTTVNSGLIQVRMSIAHNWDADVDIVLTAPNGDIIQLSTGNGGGAANYTNTVFSDAGATNITAGAAPFTGTFRPEGTIGVLCAYNSNRATFGAIGGGAINPNGTWSLFVRDNTALIAGTLTSWSITFPDFPSTSANQNVDYPGFVNMMMAPPSAGAVLGSNRVCPNVANNYGSSVAGASGYTYLWTAPTVSGNVPVIASPTSSYTNITFTNNTVTTLTYITSLTVSTECCGTLPVVTYSVQVLPDPTPPSVVDATPTNCIGGTTSLDAVSVAGFTYAWYTTATGTNLLTTGPTYVVTNTLTGTNSYYVQAIDAFGCPSTRTAVDLTGTNSPPSVGDASICASGNVTLPVIAPTPGTTYTWYTGSCGGAVVQSSSSIAYTQNFAATTNLYISATEPGCAESTCDMATVTLGAAPATVYWTGEGTTGLNNWFNVNNWASVPAVAATTFTNTAASGALADANCPAPSTNTITVAGYTQPVSSAGISVLIRNMSGPNVFNQLSFFLTAPNGNIVGLSNNRGNAGLCTLTNITFSDAGAGAMGAVCPAAGSVFDPEGATFTDCGVSSTVVSFAAIGGGAINPNGNWTITVVDNTNAGAGTGGAIAIGDWSIMFPAIAASGNCLPSCATNAIIPNTPALAVSNPPDIGFTTGLRAQALDLSLANGNTLSFSNSKSVLDICGNFTHAGTLQTNDLGLISFLGTASAQSYTNTTTVTTVTTRTDNSFNNVVINNTSLTPEIIVNGNMTIGNMVGHTKGILTFQSGTIRLPAANRLTIANRATTAISGQAITNYVSHEATTSILRRYLLSTGGSYDFPVGNTNRNSYQLQNLNFNTGHGIDFIDVNFSNPANATGTGLPIVEPLLSNYYAVLTNGGVNATTGNANGGVWTVTPNVAGTATYTTTLYGTNYTAVPSTIRHTVLKRTTAGPGAWLLDGTYVSSTLTTPITAVRSGMAGFSQFAIGMSDLVVTLPIKLENFVATCNDDVVTLKWSTTKEDSKGSFVVEKSQNGRDFVTVSSVNAIGKSDSKQYYSAADSKPYEGLTYYRLKITDKDGNSDFSKVVEVKMPCTPAQNVFYIFPNPAKTEAKVVFSSSSEGIAYVKVKNAIGQEVILNKVETLIGENSSNLNLAGFATGVYMVTVTTDTETMTGKLVVNND